MNRYKWHLIVILLVLLLSSIIFFMVNDKNGFLDQTTSQKIASLIRLSLNNSVQLGLSNTAREQQILLLINELEQRAEATSRLLSSRLKQQQWLMILLILIIFLYLSYIFFRVMYTSRIIKQSNARIKAEIAKLQTTFTSIGDAVITTTYDGHIDYMNKSACELTGYNLDKGSDLSINTVFKLFNGDDFLLPDPVAIAVKSGQVIKGKHNIFLQRRGAEQIPIIYTIAPIHNVDEQVTGTIIVFHDTIETHKLNQALSWQATHDSLTHLPNRVLLKDKLENSLKEVTTNNSLLTLFFIDLDNFKPINDQYGHDQGDRILTIIAQRLLDVIRNNDMVARLGGDEFIITLLSFHEKEEITHTLNRVMNSIGQPIPVGSTNIVLSASIGVSIFPDDNSDADTLLRHADQAMYIAKQKGRNQYHFFDVESNQLTSHRETQRQRLEQALRNNELFLEYQPKVNLRSGEIYGFEALIRWNSPEQGIVYPDQFIPLCEDSQLIIDIGEWVFTQALDQLKIWVAAGFKYHIAINIAPRQFQDPQFIDKLDQLLLAYPEIPASYIELEVLESAALQDTSKVSEIIHDCHKRNIATALDDFGTGYASLSYLKQLPANQLKIDKSFILDMLEDSDDLAIVEGIISLAKIFNRQVIAEGVESKEHGVMLLRLGCDIAQGNGISKPLPADQVLSWASHWTPDPNWVLWSEIPWDLSDFPLLIAHSDHYTSINNVIQSVSQTEDKRVHFNLLSYKQCRLGRWYYGIGQEKYGHLDIYHELEEPHRKAHELGQKMIRLRVESRQEEAMNHIPEMYTIREELLQKLNQLQCRILEKQTQKN